MKSNAIKMLVILMLFSYGCNKDRAKGNIFKDETIKKIFTLQDSRDSSGLKSYLKNNNPEYRKYAAMAFASVQDKEAVGELIILLSDESKEVKKAAAYSLGQIGDESAEKGLISSFLSEKDETIKMAILESLGKCGGDKSLELLGDPGLGDGSQIVMKGQALGIYRAVLRKKYTQKGIKTVIGTLLKKGSDDVRFYSSNVLTRIKKIDLTEYFSELTELIGSEKRINVKMNLIAGLSKCRGPKVSEYLKSFLQKNMDEKIVVNSIRALGEFEYKEISNELLKLAADKNYQISVASSEVLMRKGIRDDQQIYFETAKRAVHWRAASNLFKLALKFSQNKSEISFRIKNDYMKSFNPYQRGALLIALSEDPDNYMFVSDELFKDTVKIVSTSGMISISQMMTKKDFDPEKIVEGGKGTHTLRKVFADIFMRGIVSLDSSIISISSAALRDPKNKFRAVVKDLTSLENSIKEYQGPGREAVKMDLEKTLNYFLGTKANDEKLKSEEKPLNWDDIGSIPADQKIKIVTEEGDIIIRLFVNESPGSVSNFLALIRTGYLGKGAFHRVVPNFVIQDGCPRGDGWGGPDTVIRSEFSDLYYEEGSLGMASAGKDTEGSQWFITHSSTPHLDGRYTIFGKVIRGMEVVNRVKVGTQILSYVIIK